MKSCSALLGPRVALLCALASGCATADEPFDEDVDGDRISNQDEGDGAVDTDADTKPDSEDTDSDGDTIADSVEAGDQDLKTLPADSDGDGVADFRDLDSDDNGLPDAVELAVDSDGDGRPDFADPDNDGDSGRDVDEILGSAADCNNDSALDPEGTPESPADCDGDGTPNHMDADSDGDAISDQQEGGIDSDADGFLDRYDLDSDNDGIADSVEAGDGDPSTVPQDSDADGTPDYLDPDSDGDGVSDLIENESGTDPTQSDSDGDGVSDLVEIAAGTDATDPDDNPQAHGDFVFVVPYLQPSMPERDTLQFRTDVQFVDVYFNIDTSFSMVAELTALQQNIPLMIDELRCHPDAGNTPCEIDEQCGPTYICFEGTCVDDPESANGGQGCIPDLWSGVGKFDDCNTYRNVLHLQPNAALTAAAIPSPGGGGVEAVFQAAACVADETLCTNDNACSSDPGVASPLGCPGFRPHAVRVLIQISDADNQAAASCSALGPDEAGAELLALGIKFVGLYGTDDDSTDPTLFCDVPQECADLLGAAAGTLDEQGQTLVFPAVDVAVVDATKAAVRQIVQQVPLNVTIEASDDPSDQVDASQFIDYLEVNLSGGTCTDVSPVVDSDANGHDDAFPALLGGTRVCWDVVPVPENMTVQPTEQPQLFHASLIVKGDGSPLDAREVYFLVPPLPPEIQPPR
jgi:hypothetical protein